MTRANKGSEQPPPGAWKSQSEGFQALSPYPKQEALSGLGRGREDVGEVSERGQKEATGPRAMDTTESKEKQYLLASRAHGKGTGA